MIELYLLTKMMLNQEKIQLKNYFTVTVRGSKDLHDKQSNSVCCFLSVSVSSFQEDKSNSFNKTSFSIERVDFFFVSFNEPPRVF